MFEADVMGEAMTGQVSPEAADLYEFVACPECGNPALVEWRTEIASTNGVVEHAKVVCLDRHWYFLPTQRLTCLGS